MRPPSTSSIVSGTAIGVRSPTCSRTVRASSSTKNGLPSALATISRGGHRRRILRQHRPHDVQALLRGERLQRHLRHAGLLAPRRAIAEAVRAHHEHRGARDNLGERGEILLGRTVDPVQVLDDDDQRRVTALLDDELPQRLEDPRLRHLRREGREPLVVRDVEEMEEIGRRFEQVETRLQEVRAGLVRDLAHGIALRDAAQRPEHVEHRQVRDRQAVRAALPLDVGHRPSGQALAELEDQARLADAGFAADADDLAAAAHRGSRRLDRSSARNGGRRTSTRARLDSVRSAGGPPACTRVPASPRRCGARRARASSPETTRWRR